MPGGATEIDFAHGSSTCRRWRIGSRYRSRSVTSKWNKIEHPLFSFITLNWRGEPLINYETIINLIGGTKTHTRLKVKAVLDTNEYETGIKVSDEQLDEIRLRRHKVHPTWNYTNSPRRFT